MVKVTSKDMTCHENTNGTYTMTTKPMPFFDVEVIDHFNANIKTTTTFILTKRVNNVK